MKAAAIPIRAGESSTRSPSAREWKGPMPGAIERMPENTVQSAAATEGQVGGDSDHPLLGRHGDRLRVGDRRVAGLTSSARANSFENEADP